jgi:hypothetical protein
MDEEKILKEEQNLTTDKMIAAIRQKGPTQVPELDVKNVSTNFDLSTMICFRV